MPSIRERDIHLGLWRQLKQVVEKKFCLGDVEFVDVKFEPTINGQPDLVVVARERGREIPILVIETKRKEPSLDPRFEAFSTKVIRQAERYASWMGSPYFATCDGKRFVLFETFKEGVPLLQRRLTYYSVPWPIDEKFAQMLLEEVGKFRVGTGKWLPLDDVFVERLRSFHGHITPYIHRALIQKLRDDMALRDEYIKWLKSQLFEFSDQMNEKIAEQTAYLLINKIAFYKTLETQMSNLPKLEKIDAVDGEDFSRKLRQYFDRVLDVNYEAIFERTIFDRIPLPTKLIYPLNDFIGELSAYNLAKIQSDVLGRVYEELIPADERHRLGQYYTPPPIVELIVKMCVRSPKDKVLDPGCGSGSFLVKAYHRLKDLKRKENPFRTDADLHKELLGQLFGIDINPFPAQLSSINLAVRNLKVRSENINLIVSDFFKVKPAPPLPPTFEVVVTNPPYTRQEEMEYKKQIRDVALTYVDGSKIEIDARAGIYAYFFAHSAKFLKNEGRMGYITSNTWLDVGFGRGLKRFFLEHFKLITVIEFESRAFEKADVTTCVTMLEKNDGAEYKQRRDENVVKFVRVKSPMDVDDIIKFIETMDSNFEDDKIRLICERQGDLKVDDKWGMKYLRAPSVWFKIVNHPKITRLKEIAKIRRGFTTGAVQFFCLDKRKAKQWGIEKDYLKPVIREPSKMWLIDVKSEDVDEYLLMVHKNKDELRAKGANVLKYIEHGEKTPVPIKKGVLKGKEVVGYHKLRTVRSRPTWYDLGVRPRPPVVLCRFVEDRVIALWNKADAMALDNFYEIHPVETHYTPIILGLLHSAIGRLILELRGRHTGRGAIQLMVYEVKELPTLNPEKLRRKEREEIEKAFLELCEARRKSDKAAEKHARKELDDIIFNVLNLTDNERKKVYEGLESLRQMRLQRRGVEVLVETAEQWKAPKKRKKKVRTPKEAPSKRLDLWIGNS